MVGTKIASYSESNGQRSIEKEIPFQEFMAEQGQKGDGRSRFGTELSNKAGISQE